jgi:signal transduction histidine kinase/CheY-like chemotaxis protein
LVRARILIVEPQALPLGLGVGLSEAGHRVEVASDRAAMASQLAEHEVDVVITQVADLGDRGLEDLEVVRKVALDNEVVVVIPAPHFELALSCVRAGASDVLPQPVGTEAVASAIERAVERGRRRSSHGLVEACQAVFARHDPGDLAAGIVAAAMTVMAADEVSLMVPGVDGKLFVAHACGLPSDIKERTRLAMGERVAGRIAKERTPILITGPLRANPEFAGLEDFGRRIVSSIVYPLVSGERLVGVLNLNRMSVDRPFCRADLDRAAVLASQVLLALENAVLVRRLVASERLVAIGQLAAGVVHEINNPVGYALGGLSYVAQSLGALARYSALREQGSSQERRDAAWAELGGQSGVEELVQAALDAQDGVMRIRDIVGDMRALARMEQGQLSLFDLNESIRSAVHLARTTLRGSSVKLQAQLDDELLLVMGSVGQMSQVFVNLLVNAGHAMRDLPDDRREVVVRSRRAGAQVLAEVVDTGPGIAAELLVHLFEPFVTTKEAGQGTGLGLTISREIVQRHGGQIGVDSQLGKGTTFLISLPFAASPQPSSP